MTRETMKRLSITILIMIFFQLSLHAADRRYLVTVSVKTQVTVTRKKPCTKKVKVRKNGRWIYVKKRALCPEETEVWKRYKLKKIFKADNVKEAREEAKDHYDDEGYKEIRIITVRLLN